MDTKRLPGPVEQRWSWQLRGLCRGIDESFFFHTDGERGHARRRREDRAKAICLRCPVLEKCREHALSVEEKFGIWGALSEGERDVIFKAKRKQRAMP